MHATVMCEGWMPVREVIPAFTRLQNTGSSMMESRTTRTKVSLSMERHSELI